MAPEAGAIGSIHRGAARLVRSRQFRRNPVFEGSETETGEVAVADGDAAAGGQEAVDRSHQTAEQGAGGQEADGCSLGHVCPFSWCGTIPLHDLGTIYVYQMPATTGLFA